MNLKELSKCCKDLIKFDDEVLKIEEQLKEAKEKARTMREETIPNLMAELGLSSVTLDTGEKVTVSMDVYASIAVKDREEAFKWLTENGFASLIKTEVKTQYGKGETDKALKLFDQLSKKGLNASYSETVHPQTLKAFIKEQLANGSPIPLDLFGARPVHKTVIK